MKKLLSLAIILFVMLSSIRFFEPAFVNSSILNYLQYLGVLLAVTVSIPYMFKAPLKFVFPVYLLLISILISIFMSVLYWGQSLKDSILATFEFFLVFFFFFLKSTSISLKTFEKVILGVGIVYFLLFAFQLLNTPTVYFGRSLFGDEFTEGRGVVRVIFPAGGVLYLMTFLAFSKSTSSKGLVRWFWICISMLGILCPILQVTRQFIVVVFLILALHIILYLSLFKKAVFAFLLLMVGIVVLNSSLPIVEGLKEQSIEDLNAGSEYIRVQAGKYFLFDFSPNKITSVFGNGVPYVGTSDYGAFLIMLAYNHEYFLSDVGIIAVYAQFGVLAILAFIIIWILSISVPLQKEYYYLKYYLWLLFFTSLTWDSVYQHEYLFCNVLVLAMYQRAYEQRKAHSVDLRAPNYA